MQALGVGIRQQPLLAHLAAKPAVLHAGEVGAEVGPLVLVDPDPARLEPARDPLGLRQVRRVDRRPQPGVGEVGPPDDIVLVGPGEDREDGAWTRSVSTSAQQQPENHKEA